MTSNLSESETFASVIRCHNDGASENDIRTAFQFFAVVAGIAGHNEMKTEAPPGPGGQGRMDLYVHNTCIEFKTDIFRNGSIHPPYVAQLDGYIDQLVRAGTGVQNGILTDGVHYLIRHIGDDKLPMQQGESHAVFDTPEQAPILREYLHKVISAPASDISPTPENLTRYFGVDSDVFRAANTLLVEAHRQHRDNPTVAVKRQLWKELLQVALGQDSVKDGEQDDWLYVRHTYLTSLVGIIVQAHFEIDVLQYAQADPSGLVRGDLLLQQTGLKGITESDLFAWPTEIGQNEYLTVIANQVAQFDWQQDSDELAATLYQNIIPRPERERLGEYYTPRWLAKAITEELVNEPAITRVLDPACGSGTFIEAAIKHVIAATTDLSPSQQLDILRNNIAGIDLHPVAVQLAKATWVISCHDVIMAVRASAAAHADVTAPIHLGDSLQLRYDNSELTAQGYIELKTGEKLEGREINFQIPLSLARHTERFDNLMLEIATAIDKGDDTDRILERYGITDEAERTPLETSISNMEAMHAVNRNHVWAYYLRNMIRPAVISEQKVDVIVGNPPWLTYSQSADIIRDELKNLSENRYQTWAGGPNAPHQDVATLFYCRVMELYLQPGAKIGMVLPHSALRSGNHLKWRNGYYESKVPKGSNEAKQAISADFSIKAPWDLDNLDPNTFFPMPASVVFARAPGLRGDLAVHKRSAKPLAPGPVEMWSGPTDTRDVRREIASLIHDDGTFKSPYHNFANQGPTITDRRLFFVKAVPNAKRMALPDTYVTSPREGAQDKKRYSVAGLDGHIISGDNLFNVYLGESLAPYAALEPLTAALPVSKTNKRMPSHEDTGEVDQQELDTNMRARWEKMERLWEANRSKTDTKSLTQNLNWISKLTTQLAYLRNPGARPIRIAYTQSGRPTAALITDDTAILDRTLYQVTCSNLNEAYYLLAIINSSALAKAAKPFCTTNWAREIRHLEKHIWKLSIPLYDPKLTLHRQLARLGQTAANEAHARIEEMHQLKGLPPKSDAARNELRSNWQQPINPPKRKRKAPERFSSTASSIEQAVAQLLA